MAKESPLASSLVLLLLAVLLSVLVPLPLLALALVLALVLAAVLLAAVLLPLPLLLRLLLLAHASANPTPGHQQTAGGEGRDAIDIPEPVPARRLFSKVAADPRHAPVSVRNDFVVSSDCFNVFKKLIAGFLWLG